MDSDEFPSDSPLLFFDDDVLYMSGDELELEPERRPAVPTLQHQQHDNQSQESLVDEDDVTAMQKSATWPKNKDDFDDYLFDTGHSQVKGPKPGLSKERSQTLHFDPSSFSKDESEYDSKLSEIQAANHLPPFPRVSVDPRWKNEKKKEWLGKTGASRTMASELQNFGTTIITNDGLLPKAAGNSPLSDADKLKLAINDSVDEEILSSIDGTERWVSHWETQMRALKFRREGGS